MGKRGPSRSLFASLPVDLRNTIRTNGRYLSMNGPDLDSFQIKQEMLAESSGSGSRLLRTQPESMSPEKDEGEDPTPVIQAGPSGSGSKGFPSAAVEVEVQVEAEASLAGDVDSSPPRAVKRRRTEGAWVVGAAPSLVRPVQKRRKGKELPVHNAYEGHPWDCTGLVERYVNRDHVPDDIKKYFGQRHLLFEEYDELPLLMDHTGWFSVTAQPVARHIAERCRCDVIVDAFCGVGGNAIEFAKTCERVIAIDNDLTRLKLARHNALQYGVADRIEFIHGSYIDWARSYAAQADKEAIDVVFLSPPWGGVNYLTVSADPLPFPPTPSAESPSAKQPTTHTFPLSAILPIPGDELFRISAAITPNIAYYLPRNVNMKEVAQLARRLDPPEMDDKGGMREKEWVEVEEEVVGEKVKAVTVYYGSLIADGS
ncbi:RNA cap guanine-N2 methyltransferase-domain-containing protein [Dioszegia hungarica]|uniref:Trimethylguanosine synthase n=1 Tax=Dioszegia hungarica TaxID=4972 RepID=A0AA38LXR2_9TREE|nr:RNA cap guanine-N2 methyltransferase-domain-containing protein [Dioszegia hungarica]KAI9638998.1 RNA cap guanine-N2 methyltransferase-domain-containing protein [Dioszegia hungarica]